MISRIHLFFLLAIAATLWALMLVLDGMVVSFAFFKPFSIVLGTMVLVLIAFDRYGWKWSVLYPWFVSIPNLQGTWKGQLISTWIDPKTGSQQPPIEAYMLIRQTFSSIHMRLLTRESNSEMLAGNIVQDADGVHTIAGTYRNITKLLRRETSPIHYGGLLLHVRGNPPQVLEGQYWTDRDSKGELRFAESSKMLYHDFESASTGKYGKARA